MPSGLNDGSTFSGTIGFTFSRTVGSLTSFMFQHTSSIVGGSGFRSITVLAHTARMMPPTEKPSKFGRSDFKM